MRVCLNTISVGDFKSNDGYCASRNSLDTYHSITWYIAFGNYCCWSCAINKPVWRFHNSCYWRGAIVKTIITILEGVHWLAVPHADVIKAQWTDAGKWNSNNPWPLCRWETYQGRLLTVCNRKNMGIEKLGNLKTCVDILAWTFTNWHPIHKLVQNV